MKLTDEQQRFLKEHDVELILREMEVRDYVGQNWARRYIVFQTKDGDFIDSNGCSWACAEEIPKFELTREKALEWANHEEQQDTFVRSSGLHWHESCNLNYNKTFDNYVVRQNGDNRRLPEVVEEWYRGREL